MPPTPTALLMTALALLVLPACSGFRVARVSESPAGDEAEAAAAGGPGAAPAKKKKSVAWVEGTSDALTC